MIRKLPALLNAWKTGMLDASRRNLYAAGLPFQPRNDDLFLVEFPKSGITWLTFLIANTNLLLAGDTRRRVTFFNILDLVPDVHVSRNIAPPAGDGLGFRCIKSHSAYNPSYRKVVYLVRDPRNVMASYYVFLTKLGWYQGSFEQMVKSSRFGIQAWRRHVRSWLDSIPPTHSFMIVRYEDLVAGAGAEIQRVYRQLGWDLDGVLVAEAVKKSGLETMRNEEELFNRDHPALADFSLTRDGKADGARREMNDSLKAYIEAVASAEMMRFGYMPQ